MGRVVSILRGAIRHHQSEKGEMLSPCSHGGMRVGPGQSVGHLLVGFFPSLTVKGHVYQLWPENSMTARGSDC